MFFSPRQQTVSIDQSFVRSIVFDWFWEEVFGILFDILASVLHTCIYGIIIGRLMREEVKKKKKKYVVSIEYIQINVRNHGRDFVSGLGLYLGSIAFLYCFLSRHFRVFWSTTTHNNTYNRTYTVHIITHVYTYKHDLLRTHTQITKYTYIHTHIHKIHNIILLKLGGYIVLYFYSRYTVIAD